MCGNFGLLLLDKAAAGKVKTLLETMLRVTMMRGAQSAGLVTYVGAAGEKKGFRRRVVNGKRTDVRSSSRRLDRKSKSLSLTARSRGCVRRRSIAGSCAT